MDTTAPQEKANGLATYVSVLTSPTAAFAQLGRVPTWGWAAIIGLLLLFVATILSLPEQTRIAEIAQQQALSQMSAEQQAQARPGMAAAGGFIRGSILIGGLVAPWIIWLISAVVFLIGAAVTGATTKFSLAWAAAVNACIVAFVGAIVNAVVLAIHGPDAINSPLDAYALPSLGMLVHGNVKLATFLNGYGIFYIWYYIIAVIALEQALKMKRPAAIVTVVVYSLLSAGIAAAFAR